MIKKGAVVKLKSGEPKMTVRGLASGLWICSWFTGDDMKEGMFSEEQLDLQE